MPLAKTPVPHTLKRQLHETHADPSSLSQSSAKRQKRDHHHQRHRTPPSFYDNLSRLWLTPRVLREFDRRTVWPSVPAAPSYPTTKEITIDDAKLKRFARQGGPSLVDIRGYPDPEPPVSSASEATMNSHQAGSRKRQKTESEASTKRTSAYDEGFEQNLIDYGIYPQGYGEDWHLQKPDNLDEIKVRLARPRASLSPSRFTEDDFRKFEKKNLEALGETKVMSRVFPTIAGTADIHSEENLRFLNLRNITDGSIVKAQPDWYDGARPETVSKRIRDEFGPFIVPSSKAGAPCLPNFFGEGKGPKGTSDVAKLQATYNGALGGRGIHKLRRHVDLETANDNKAYTITCTYHPNGLLTLYTTHPVKSTNPSRETDYRMTKLNAYAMTGDSDQFRRGATALRNSRDYMDEVRRSVIAAAEATILTNAPTRLQSAHLESDTSADELGLDLGTPSSSHRVAGATHGNHPMKPSSDRLMGKWKSKGP
ncbi:MAG: hypothetical protein L6R39_002779 [Caloplaca ligustica]|nr:MAG: hypothetical protein L6R39_002779 [Caloplaca ligustica]